MDRSTRLTLMVLGCCWGQAMLVLGLSLLGAAIVRGGGLQLGLAMVGAGLFLAMWLVIDELVPDASRAWTLLLKFAAITLFYVCGALTLYSYLTGRPVVI